MFLRRISAFLALGLVFASCGGSGESSDPERKETTDSGDGDGDSGLKASGDGDGEGKGDSSGDGDERPAGDGEGDGTGGMGGGSDGSGGGTEMLGGMGGELGSGGSTPEHACDDGEQNGGESDVDCGGVCEACSNGQSCEQGGDCESGHCVEGLCTAPPQFSAPLTLATSGVSTFSVAQNSFGNTGVFYGNGDDDTLWLRISTGKNFGGALRVDGSNGRPSIAPTSISAYGGNYLLTWRESNSGFGTYSRVYSTGWGSIRILHEASHSHGLPRVAINSSGNGLIGESIHYIGGTPTNDTIRVRLVSGGAILSSEELAFEVAYSNVLTSMTESNHGAIAWTVPGGTGTQLWVRRLVPGTGLLAEELLADAEQLTLQKLSAQDDGSVLVFWQEGDTDLRLYEGEFSPGSTWSSPRLLDFSTENFLGVSTLVRSASGVLMWMYNADDTVDAEPLEYFVRDSSGNWSDAIAADAQARYLWQAELVSYGADNFRVFYHRDGANSIELWSARYVDGRGFIDQAAVATDYYISERPVAGLDESGRGIVVWRRRNTPSVNAGFSLHARWLE